VELFPSMEKILGLVKRAMMNTKLGWIPQKEYGA
jgi:hypothetical protein